MHYMLTPFDPQVRLYTNALKYEGLTLQAFCRRSRLAHAESCRTVHPAPSGRAFSLHAKYRPTLWQGPGELSHYGKAKDNRQDATCSKYRPHATFAREKSSARKLIATCQVLQTVGLNAQPTFGQIPKESLSHNWKAKRDRTRTAPRGKIRNFPSRCSFRAKWECGT